MGSPGNWIGKKNVRAAEETQRLCRSDYLAGAAGNTGYVGIQRFRDCVSGAQASSRGVCPERAETGAYRRTSRFLQRAISRGFLRYAACSRQANRVTKRPFLSRLEICKCMFLSKIPEILIAVSRLEISV